MPDEATLLVRIKTILDKSSVLKDMKEIGNKVQDAVGLSDVGSGSGSGSKKKNPIGMIGSGITKGIKGMGRVVGLLGKIFAGVSLAMVAIEVFKPAINFANAIVKQIAEFIRPISDIFIMLLSPILMTVKPIVQMFRVLMQPFRQIAMSGLAAANVLISQGMRTGGETGGAMVGAGFEGAVSSASLMMSGFLQATVGKLLGGIEAFGIGDAITNALDAWESQALEGIMKVQLKADLVRDLGNTINDIDISTLENSFKTINQYVEDLSDKVGGFNTTNFSDNLATAQTQMDTVFDPLVTMLSSDGDLATYIDTTTEIMKGMGIEFSSTAAQIAISIQDVMIEWQTAIDAMNPGSAGNIMKAGMPSLIEELSNVKETSFLTKLIDFGKAYAGKSPFGKMDTTDIDKWVDDASVVRNSIVEEYFAGFAQVEAEQKNGLLAQLETQKLYTGTNGYVPTAALDGFKQMNKGSNEFLVNMTNASKDLVNLSKIAANATKSALSSAKSAEKAANRSRS